jgi:putative DNA primase/helicase
MTLTKSQVESGSARPAITVDFDSIPQQLRDYPHWTLWEWHRDYRRGGKWTKVPVCPQRQPHGGWLILPGSSTDPAKWMTFQAAARWCAESLKRSDRQFGIGFVFSDSNPFFGVDIDDSRDTADGSIAPWAQPWIDSLGTYCEVSPSGTGVKLIGIGAAPGKSHREGKFEHYDSGRFFTVTGNRLAGTPGTVAECQDAYTNLYHHLHQDETPEKLAARAAARAELAARICAGSAGAGGRADFGGMSLSDREVNERAAASAGGSLFERAFQGDASAFGDDNSRLDYYLAKSYAFWVGPDHSRILSLMWGSAAVRPKWSTNRTYLDRTVERAIADTDSFYGDGSWKPSGLQCPDADLVKLSAADRDSILQPLLSSTNRRQAARQAAADAAREAAVLSVTAFFAATDHASLVAAAAEVAEDAAARSAAAAATDSIRQFRSEYCPHAHRKNFADIEAGTVFTKDMPCRRWGCTVCHRRQKGVWIPHLAACIQKEPTDQFHTATVGINSRGGSAPDGTYSHKGLTDRLTRSRAHWCAIRRHCESEILIATAPFPGSAPLSRADAITLMTTSTTGIPLSDDMRGPGHPIRRCDAWRLPPPKRLNQLTALPGFDDSITWAEIMDGLQAEGFAPDLSVSASETVQRSARWNLSDWIYGTYDPDAAREERVALLTKVIERVSLRARGADPDAYRAEIEDNARPLWERGPGDGPADIDIDDLLAVLTG